MEYNLPTVLVRIFSFYGPRGGGPTERVYKIAHDQPVSVYPGARNVYTPMYEDDYVEKTIASIGIAKAPAEIINLAGEEAVTIPEYCEMAGEMLGKTVRYVENGVATPIWGDATKMVKMLGPCRVSMREGIRRIVDAGVPAPITAHAMVGQPK
jgi:nucleoside-diphosphate-sugar epimerase